MMEDIIFAQKLCIINLVYYICSSKCLLMIALNLYHMLERKFRIKYQCYIILFEVMFRK